MEHTRRDFLATGASGLGVAWLATQIPAIEAAARLALDSRANGVLAVLTPEEARELEAVAGTILPAVDDRPGAREAGVIHFIDRAFETFQAPALGAAREGLATLQTRVEARYPGAGPFSALSEARRVEILREIENEGFFSLLRFLTVAGMFALPEYGGNGDGLGWALLGFEDRFVWQPPFGFYDAEVTGG